MNDFTKEDLQDIANALENWVPDHIGLRDKIQSMIDSYCEHDCKYTIWQCQVTACSKCGFPSTIVKR